MLEKHPKFKGLWSSILSYSLVPSPSCAFLHCCFPPHTPFCSLWKIIPWWTDHSTSPACLLLLALTERWLSYKNIASPAKSWIEGCLPYQASYTSGLGGRVGLLPAPQCYCQTIILKINKRLNQLVCPPPLYPCPYHLTPSCHSHGGWKWERHLVHCLLKFSILEL